jgi:peptidoglycan/xylan/chitin deacetylase (PgdA/CDA1 family)
VETVLRRSLPRLPSAALLALLLACSTSSPRGPASPQATAAASPTPVEVAVTVDDLPAHGPLYSGMDRVTIVERLLDAFRRHRLPPVYGFVNGKKVDEAPESEVVLRRWLAAGNPLGNHTWSHPSLNATSLPDYFADLEKGEAILKKLEPDAATWKVFRYPFLFEGDTAVKRDTVRGYLREHGYTVAEVTIDADDWAFNAPFARCRLIGDAVALAELRRSFVEAHVEELRLMRELGRALVRRDVRHVLLLHAGVAEADAIDSLLSAYESEGVRWIDLRAALADPIYAIDPGQPFPFGAAFPYLIAKARGVTVAQPIYARDLEERLDRVCR